MIETMYLIIGVKDGVRKNLLSELNKGTKVLTISMANAIAQEFESKGWKVEITPLDQLKSN